MDCKQECAKKYICKSHPNDCGVCKEVSFLGNRYPLFKEKDIVEVVRCKDCEYCEVLEMDYGGKQYWCKFWSTPKREYADAFCCHGKTKEK